MYHYEQSSGHPDTCSVARMPNYTCLHTHTPPLFWDQLCLVRDNLSCPFCIALPVSLCCFMYRTEALDGHRADSVTAQVPLWCHSPQLGSSQSTSQSQTAFQGPDFCLYSSFNWPSVLCLPPSLTPHTINNRAKVNTTRGGHYGSRPCP